jgi:hypothetical protein
VASGSNRANGDLQMSHYRVSSIFSTRGGEVDDCQCTLGLD